MRAHHQCAMTLRHLASRRSLALRCQGRAALTDTEKSPLAIESHPFTARDGHSSDNAESTSIS